MQSKNYTTIRIVPMDKYDKRALHNQSECVHHRMRRRCAQKTGLLLNTAALFMFVASFYFYSKLFGVCNKVCTNESACNDQIVRRDVWLNAKTHKLPTNKLRRRLLIALTRALCCFFEINVQNPCCSH